MSIRTMGSVVALWDTPSWGYFPWLLLAVLVAGGLSAETVPVTPKAGNLPSKSRAATVLESSPHPSLVKAATLIVHAKIDGIWEERTGFAIVRCARFRTLKGKFDNKEIWVKVPRNGANPSSKNAPSVAGTPPQKTDFLNNISLGKEFVLFLEPEPTASGTFRILRQGREQGLAPYSKSYLDNVRKSIKGLDPKTNETTTKKKSFSEKR